VSVLECRAVTRRFERPDGEALVAVDAVDLEIEAGQVVSIVGPSGSGKTTLLGLLAGLDRPDSGDVSVSSFDLARLTPTERARLRRRQIGIVFQTFGLVPSLTAGENVGLPLLLSGVAVGERAQRSAEALATVGLPTAASARIDTLSGGERQRVAVARALVHAPTILLADEPTGSLDDANAGVVLDLLIGAVRETGCCLVLVTHDPGSAARADRRYRLRDGRLLPEAA
jgi:putative ABC transport system ATP-binding protein